MPNLENRPNLDRLEDPGLDSYIFSRNAPKKSLEHQLITELIEANDEYKTFSNISTVKLVLSGKLKEKIVAKTAVNNAAKKVMDAHEEFIKRGKKYITPNGKIIS